MTRKDQNTMHLLCTFCEKFRNQIQKIYDTSVPIQKPNSCKKCGRIT